MTPLLTTLLGLVVATSTIYGAGAAVWATAPGRETRRRPKPHGALALFAHPLTQWAIVIGLVVVNQIAFNAYVLRVHHGDASFIGRYLPSFGWLSLALDWPSVRWVAAHVGDGRWLAPSVLRVQAYLELPFTLYAYLAVARMLGRDVTRALCRWPVLLVASVSFSVTFGLIEASLPNPYTNDDLVLRALAAVTVPFWVAWTSRIDDAARDGDDRPTSVLGILAFLIGAASIALSLLAAYDTLLLYNLAHLPRYVPLLVLTTPIAVFAPWLVPRVGRARPSSASTLLRAMLAAFTVVFFVPSLAIRYAMPYACTALFAAFVLLFGAGLGIARLRQERADLDPMPLALSVVAGGIAGGVASFVVFVATGIAADELGLACVAVAFLAAFTIAAHAAERAAAAA